MLSLLIYMLINSSMSDRRARPQTRRREHLQVRMQEVESCRSGRSKRGHCVIFARIVSMRKWACVLMRPACTK